MEVNLLLQEQQNAILFLDFQLHITDNTTEEGDQRQPQSSGSTLAPAENDVGNNQDIEDLIDEDDDGNAHLWRLFTKMLGGKNITIAQEVSLDVISLHVVRAYSRVRPRIRV
jgi:hypothetical protein